MSVYDFLNNRQLGDEILFRYERDGNTVIPHVYVNGGEVAIDTSEGDVKITLDGETVTLNTSADIPVTMDGDSVAITIADKDIWQEILNELRTIRVHMSLITDEVIHSYDVEEM